MAPWTTRFQSIAQMFRWASEEEKKTQMQLARLCVPYEDAQIGWTGAFAEEFKELERSDKNRRRFYFARRILAATQ